MAILFNFKHKWKLSVATAAHFMYITEISHILNVA